MRVALVHDYLSQDGGAERVLKAMHEIWPDAPIFVLFHDQKKINYFPDKNIHQSFISKLPFAKKYYQWYLPLMPLATEKYYLKDYDMVISSTSAFAKGIIVQPDTVHISYCHTPPRYLWSPAYEYVTDLNCGPVVKTFLPGIIHKLRLWDKMSADRVDHFVANSETVRRRIAKYYRRDSTVVYPPVDTNKFYISEKIENYFIAGGRLVPYKKLDVVVKTFNRLKWPLKIFGIGPELKKLKKMAKPNIEFLGKISDEQKSDMLSRARAFIHPQNEDFGLTPVEAMASGRPVIAYQIGGASETVIQNETGLFLENQSWENLLNTVLNFEKYDWDSRKIREQALKFEIANFKQKLKQLAEDKYACRKP